MADRSGNRKLVQLGDDGELLSGVFCVKCGTLNPHGVQYCQKCHDILAEQGPDLPKRLARISRHASQTRTDAPPPSYHTGQFETFVGKTTQVRKSRFTASKRYTDMNRYYRHAVSEMPLVPSEDGQHKSTDQDLNSSTHRVNNRIIPVMIGIVLGVASFALIAATILTGRSPVLLETNNRTNSVITMRQEQAIYATATTNSPDIACLQRLRFEKERIAIQATQGKYQRIYLTNKNGSIICPLTNGSENSTFPSWSPDGNRIVFERSGSLYVVEASGFNLRQLTNGRTDTQPTWSPDGKLIAFTANRFLPDNPDIYVMNADGSDIRRLTDNRKGEIIGPVWSPDGTKLAFSQGGGRDWNVYTISIDGSGRTLLPQINRTTYGAVWSPDGTSIALISGVDTDLGLYVIVADGRNPRHITDDLSGNKLPVWLPDGKTLAFISSSGSRSKLYTVYVNGLNLRLAAELPFEITAFAWSFNPTTP